MNTDHIKQDNIRQLREFLNGVYYMDYSEIENNIIEYSKDKFEIIDHYSDEFQGILEVCVMMCDVDTVANVLVEIDDGLITVNLNGNVIERK